jgi:hypothetical protein
MLRPFVLLAVTVAVSAALIHPPFHKASRIAIPANLDKFLAQSYPGKW